MQRVVVGGNTKKMALALISGRLKKLTSLVVQRELSIAANLPCYYNNYVVTLDNACAL